MTKLALILVPFLLLSCTGRLPTEDVSVDDDKESDRAAVSFPAPPKVPDVQQ